MSLKEFDYYWNISLIKNNLELRRFILSREDTKTFIKVQSVVIIIKSRVLANWLASRVVKCLIDPAEALSVWRELTFNDALKLKSSDETNCYGLIRDDLLKLSAEELGC